MQKINKLKGCKLLTNQKILIFFLKKCTTIKKTKHEKRIKNKKFQFKTKQNFFLKFRKNQQMSPLVVLQNKR